MVPVTASLSTVRAVVTGSADTTGTEDLCDASAKTIASVTTRTKDAGIGGLVSDEIHK